MVGLSCVVGANSHPSAGIGDGGQVLGLLLGGPSAVTYFYVRFLPACRHCTVQLGSKCPVMFTSSLWHKKPEIKPELGWGLMIPKAGEASVHSASLSQHGPSKGATAS